MLTLSSPTGPRDVFTMLAMAATAVMFCRRTSCPDCRLPWIWRAAFPDIGIAMLPLPPAYACSLAWHLLFPVTICVSCINLNVKCQDEQRPGMQWQSLMGEPPSSNAQCEAAGPRHG